MALVLTSVGVLPTVGMIVWSAIAPSLPLLVATSLVGIANGFAAAWVLGRIAIGYLQTRMPDVFSRIRYGQVFRDHASGVLDSIAKVTLKGEQQYAEQKQAERTKRLEKAR